MTIRVITKATSLLFTECVYVPATDFRDLPRLWKNKAWFHFRYAMPAKIFIVKSSAQLMRNQDGTHYLALQKNTCQGSEQQICFIKETGSMIEKMLSRTVRKRLAWWCVLHWWGFEPLFMCCPQLCRVPSCFQFLRRDDIAAAGQECHFWHCLYLRAFRFCSRHYVVNLSLIVGEGDTEHICFWYAFGGVSFSGPSHWWWVGGEGGCHKKKGTVILLTVLPFPPLYFVVKLHVKLYHCVTR